MVDRAEIDLRWKVHMCHHLIGAARAAGAKATYEVESASVKVQDGEWGPYKISEEFASDIVNLLGDKQAWEVLRHKMSSEGGNLLYDKDILMQECRDLDV